MELALQSVSFVPVPTAHSIFPPFGGLCFLKCLFVRILSLGSFLMTQTLFFLTSDDH